MIIFENCTQEPFNVFKDLYNMASNEEKAIEAMSLSTIDLDQKKPFSRYVNIKYVKNNKLVFFTNYNSNKSNQLEKANNVSCIFYWKSINTQIRIEGSISKSDRSLSDHHFSKRSLEKNALAISSNQSKSIECYEKVVEKYNEALSNITRDTKRPDYWGGLEVSPNYFEFWTGNKNRLNKRKEYRLIDDKSNIWQTAYLEP